VGLEADIRPDNERELIVNALKARSGLRTLLGLTAALGLVAALAMPVAAAPHEGNPGGNCDETETSVKVETSDGSIVLEAGTIFCVKQENSNTGTLVADGVTTLAEYAEQAGLNPGVSHYVVYGMETATPTPTPTPEVTPTPTPEEGEEGGTPTPTATPTEAGEVEAGNPTPAAGALPNTAVAFDGGAVPAAMLSLLLIGSLAAMAYLRLARQR
jgi:hypothetical protein